MVLLLIAMVTSMGVVLLVMLIISIAAVMVAMTTVMVKVSRTILMWTKSLGFPIPMEMVYVAFPMVMAYIPVLHHDGNSPLATLGVMGMDGEIPLSIIK